MDRRRLADFLRRSRERISPEEAGLPGGPRRRTPGLRREEVSQLAGMSADYYMRLEQARSPQPSTQLLGALARALRLTDEERDHLYLLAGHRPPPARPGGVHIRPGLLRVLDELTDSPAQIMNDMGDVLAQNVMADALLGTICSVREGERNFVWRWFTEEAMRAPYPADELDDIDHYQAASLRAAATRRGNDTPSTELIRRLHAASPRFAELWKLHEVAFRQSSFLRVAHPVIGPISLEWEILLTPSEDQRLMIYTPSTGSEDVTRLAMLRVLGSSQFAYLGAPSAT
ncbi:helix-turn-helix transcriptional regulator [Kribbella sancticallisti]|uniref:Helix-turn-helix transcriptional regulator n=1 Tax=Kribbella sancticallisti TaxID=460087 RepID=A0ABN2ED84_9ACTN